MISLMERLKNMKEKILFMIENHKLHKALDKIK